MFDTFRALKLAQCSDCNRDDENICCPVLLRSALTKVPPRTPPACVAQKAPPEFCQGFINIHNGSGVEVKGL